MKHLLKINRNDHLVTFDMKSLFKQVPAKDSVHYSDKKKNQLSFLHVLVMDHNSVLEEESHLHFCSTKCDLSLRGGIKGLHRRSIKGTPTHPLFREKSRSSNRYRRMASCCVHQDVQPPTASPRSEEERTRTLVTIPTSMPYISICSDLHLLCVRCTGRASLPRHRLFNHAAFA